MKPGQIVRAFLLVAPSFRSGYIIEKTLALAMNHISIFHHKVFSFSVRLL